MTDNLKEKTARGIMWGFVNNGASQLLNLVFGIFLARLLTPDDYGVVGVLAIFSAIAMSLQTSGFHQALVNLRKPTDEDYSSVFWFNIMVSVVLYVLFFFSAPLIANFFHQPCLVGVSRVLFLCLPIYALSITSSAYLVKNMMNREIAIIGIAAILLSGLTGITLAWLGCSYWSLVWQQIVSASVILIGRFYYVRFLPYRRINFGPVKRMFGFSMNLLFTNILQIVNFHLLTFFLGRYMPIGQVGYYTQANKWNNLSKTIITDGIGQVTQTVLVSVSDEREREVRVFRKLMRLTAFLAFPAMLGLALVAHEFVLLLLGPQWEGSVVLLQVLCIGGAFLPFYMLYQNLCVSQGRSDLYLWCTAGQMVLQMVAILFLYKKGIIAVVTACSALNIVWLLVWQWTAHRLIRLRFAHMLLDTMPFLLVAVAVMGVTWIVTAPIRQMVVLLVVRIVMAALLYAGLMRLLRAKVMDECIGFFLKKNKART